MGILNEDDKQILPLSLRQNKGFHIGTKWYCRGWDPLWYQYAFHQSTHKNTTVLAGIAAGKTTAVAASYMIDCLTTPYFRALNTSVTAKQAEIPFEMVQAWIEENNHIQHMIEDVSLRPYPTIKFQNGSEWIFRTAGRDGRFIRGLEFDRINYDEAGLDFTGETVKVLRGRLRGVRPDNTIRMARLDVITSPTDAPWLRERWERGFRDNATYDPEFLSLRVRTYDNTRLEPIQIKMMEAEYSDDMIDVEMNAKFPEYGSSFFPKGHIHACTDQSLNDAVEEALRPETGSPLKGYVVEEHPRYGITRFEIPPRRNGVYVMGGDPGTDSPPHRNAGCVMCADISKKPIEIVYFHWTDGRGSYNPFLSSYKYAIQKYKPLIKGMDTTGTQKAIDELAFENLGISIDGISFNRDKEAILNSLSVAITDHSIKWPVIRGLIRQLSSYSRESDLKKLPQDLVMTLGEIAFLARYANGDEPDSDSSDEEEIIAKVNRGYNPRKNRTNSSRRR